MATGSILLMPQSAVFPDGSASNAAPGITRRKGTQTAPPVYYLTLDFDAATKEICYWSFPMPNNYASGGTLKLLWHANATANSAIWSAAISAVTATDADTPLEHAFGAEATATTAANATEARRLIESSITLTMDSAAAGDLITLRLFRDAANASDTLTVDAELAAAYIDYVTS